MCAGFPCQPFSKAGEQLGTKCRLWGDLCLDHVLRVIKMHKPAYLLMENVANLERHDGGRTWAKMRRQLEALGYEVDARRLVVVPPSPIQIESDDIDHGLHESLSHCQSGIHQEPSLIICASNPTLDLGFENLVFQSQILVLQGEFSA